MSAFQIKNRWSGEALFECELSAEVAGQEFRFQLGFAVRKAVEARANLSGANLIDANLSGANLSGANLSGANLIDANLIDANLSGANLIDANLSGANLIDANLIDANLSGANLSGANLIDANLIDANLRGANLSGAYLSGANLRGANGEKLTLIGPRPYLEIGPIGSEFGALQAWTTDLGIYVKRGCFFGTIPEFLAKLEKTHGNNEHATEYRAAIALIEAHARMWPGKAVTESAEASA